MCGRIVVDEFNLSLYQGALPDELRHRLRGDGVVPPRTVLYSSISRSGVCLSAFGFSLVMALSAALVAGLVAVGAFLLRSRNDKE